QKCDQLMALFHEVFSKNAPMNPDSIQLKDLYKWLGDGTTATSQHFWRSLGSHINPSNQYQNTKIVLELSTTQLPHFIAGLKDNTTELAGKWRGNTYAKNVLEQALTCGPVNPETFPILEKSKREIEESIAKDTTAANAVKPEEILA